jgi:hypothetical protein
MTRAWALVGCSASKMDTDEKVPIQELYDSDYFDKRWEYAKQNANFVSVLSAKHGIADEGLLVEHYDARLGRDVDKEEWAEKVSRQLDERAEGMGPFPSHYDEIIVLAGSDYVETIRDKLESFGMPVRRPLEGMGIGEQKAWLKEQNKTRRQATLGAVEGVSE